MVFRQCAVNGKVFSNQEEMQTQAMKKKFDDENDKKTTAMLKEFCHHLSLSHSIIVDVNKQLNTKNFLASSPDELALIEGAKWGGYTFAARNKTYVGLENAHNKSKEIYEIL